MFHQVYTLRSTVFRAYHDFPFCSHFPFSTQKYIFKNINEVYTLDKELPF